MAEWTEKQVLEGVATVKAALADGFQWEDVKTIIEVVTQFSELTKLTGPEKRALAIAVANKVIDETDTPWLPDPLVDPLMKRLLPSLIDLVVNASKGSLGLNKDK